jgi:hypothetical protein
MANRAFQRQEPTYMFRKTIIATAAIATLVAAALPSTASAHRRHHGHGFGIGLGFVGAGIYAGGCQTVYEWRVNRRGRYVQVPVTYCY